MQRRTFIGLDAQHQKILRQAFDRHIAKQRERRAAESDGDFGLARAERLAGAQIERHAGPAPIIDRKPHGDIGFGHALRRDAGRRAVAGHVLAADAPGDVLAAHHVG